MVHLVQSIDDMFCFGIRQGKRLHNIVAQSQDSANLLHNLEITQLWCAILRMHIAISRLLKFSDCAEHIHCSVHIVKRLSMRVEMWIEFLEESAVHSYCETTKLQLVLQAATGVKVEFCYEWYA